MRLVNAFIAVSMVMLNAGCSTMAPKQEASDATSIVMAADAAYQKGQWAVAEKKYRDVIAHVPNDAYAHFKLGNTLIRLERLEDASVAFRNALVAEPTHAKAASNMATVYLMLAEHALHVAIDQMKHNDPRAAMLMLRERKIHEVVDIPVDENRAGGKHVRYESK